MSFNVLRAAASTNLPSLASCSAFSNSLATRCASFLSAVPEGGPDLSMGRGGRVSLAAFAQSIELAESNTQAGPHRSGMERLLKHLNCVEGVHRVGSVVTFGVASAYVFAGHAVVGLYIALLTLLLHIYPVMLQRRNRGHVLRLARRLDTLR